MLKIHVTLNTEFDTLWLLPGNLTSALGFKSMGFNHDPMPLSNSIEGKQQVKLWFYKLPPAVLAEFRQFKMAQF